MTMVRMVNYSSNKLVNTRNYVTSSNKMPRCVRVRVSRGHGYHVLYVPTLFFESSVDNRIRRDSSESSSAIMLLNEAGMSDRELLHGI